MCRTLFRVLATVSAGSVLLLGVACSNNRTDTQQSYLEELATKIFFAPNPVSVTDAKLGSLVSTAITVSTTSDSVLDLSDFRATPAEYASVSVDSCGADYLESDDPCTMYLVLNLLAAGAPTSGSGVISLSVTDVGGAVDIGPITVELPFSWTATPTTTTTTASTTTVANTSTTTEPSTTATDATTSSVATTAPVQSGPPAISVSPSSSNFGSVTYNAAARAFVITNTGGGRLQFSSFGFADGSQFFYVGSNSCQGASLTTGKSCTVKIGVGATTGDSSPPPGPHADTFNIASNGGSAAISLSYTTPGDALNAPVVP